MTRRSLSIIGVLTLFVFSPFFFKSSVYAAVLINELYPKTSDITLEWVELYNTGTETVSLNQWRLDHTGTNSQSFVLNASMTIQPHGFLTINENQSTIVFSIDGDTVRLFDANGALVDSQSYPGILGYNTSMGRSSDGAGSWTICTIPTYNMTNNCPPPTPTPTALPTTTPTETPVPLKQPLVVTPTQQTFGSLLPTPTVDPYILGAENTLTPTPTPTPAGILQFAIPKTWVAYVLLGIADIAFSLIVILWLWQRFMRKQKRAGHS